MNNLRLQRAIAVVLGAFAGFVGAGNAAAVDIPDKPLLVADGVAPNIMFILDDSGSMQFTAMPEEWYDSKWTTYWDGSCSFNGYFPLPDEPRYRSSHRNTIYYDPAKTYEPWKKVDGTRYAATPYTNVYTSPVTLSNDTGHVDWQGANCVRGNGLSEDLSEDVQTFWVLKAGSPAGSTNDGDYKKYTIEKIGGVLRVLPSLPNASRTEAEEIQNFANWYSFHRTRMKVAKAGASEAFGGVIGANVRVGFDTIWNRPQGSRSGGSTSGATPSLAIRGRYDGGNAPTFFNYLQAAQATGGTPLHGALQRAGRYYQTTAPYRDTANGTPLACRANYAILTTDGYWNNNSGYSASDGTAGMSVGDEDGDEQYQTLADVAYAYYRNDLMSASKGEQALDNKVEPSSREPSDYKHQRMVTFGVSIGLAGTKPVPANESQWPARNDKTFWPSAWGASDSPGGSWNKSESNTRIDDLWHAAVNTTGKFIVAADSKSFSDGLKSALNEIQDRRLSGGGITTNSSRLDDDVRSFQATFNPASWQGDVVATNASNAGGDSVAWRYSAKVQAAGANFIGGTVLTYEGSSGKNFVATGGPSNIAGLARAVGGTNYTAAQILDYLKGNPQFEVRNGGKLRNRTVPVGDIVNSAPHFDRETDTIYVGANDGFLHAMTGTDGTPKFRYLPRAARYNRLSELADPAYGKDASHPHRHFMDGQIYVSPKRVSAANDNDTGRNFLLGAMGRGGKGVFLLNVSDPAAMETSHVKWDDTFQDGDTGVDADMGYVLGQTAILRDQAERIIAIVPNGVNSANGRAVMFLYVLNADGSVASKTKLQTPGANNGMMSVGAADANSDGLVDTLYGGDLQGNVWKWVVPKPKNNNDTPAWTAAFGTTAVPIPMFTARNASSQVQAITSGIAIARKPGGSEMNVIFGTGRYIEDTDVNNTDVQTIYSLVDSPSNTNVITGRGQLTQRTFPNVGANSQGRFARSLQDYAPIENNKRGWYLDLGKGDQQHPAAGERVIARPQIRGDMLVVGTLIPKASSDPCDAGRTTGFDIRVNAFTGTNPGSGSYYGNGGTTERLDGATSGSNNAVGSVQSDVGGIGGVRITNRDVILGGMDGEIDRSGWNNPNNTAPRRIMWRELVEGP